MQLLLSQHQEVFARTSLGALMASRRRRTGKCRDFLHRLRLNNRQQVAGAGEVIEQPSTSGFGPKLTFARREGMSAFERFCCKTPIEPIFKP